MIDRSKTLKIIESMTLMDDVFMTVFFKDRPDCVEEVLNAVLPFKVTVKSVHTQYDYRNIYGRAVIFDVYAKDSEDKSYNIEIQRFSAGAVPQRARFHSSLLDVKALKKGQDFTEITDTYVIFITEYDVIGIKKPIYHIERTVLESNEQFNDGSHILYINTAYEGNCKPELENLIHDFRCADPALVRNERLKKRFAQLKSDAAAKEADEMCKVLEDIIKEERAESRAEGRAEGRKEGRAEGREESLREIAKEMLSAGNFTVELIAKFCHLTVEEVNELKASA